MGRYNNRGDPSASINFPDSLAMFPLYALSFIKTVVMSNTKIHPDTRSAPTFPLSLNFYLSTGHHIRSPLTVSFFHSVPKSQRCASIAALNILPVEDLVLYLYPRLYQLSSMDPNCGLMDDNGFLNMPNPLNLSSGSLTFTDGLFSYFHCNFFFKTKSKQNTFIHILGCFDVFRTIFT